MTERPGTWQRVRTNAGWHLRLIGANGEPVLTSEVYTRPETATEALAVVFLSTGMTTYESGNPPLVDVDERGTGPVT